MQWENLFDMALGLVFLSLDMLRVGLVEGRLALQVGGTRGPSDGDRLHLGAAIRILETVDRPWF